MADVNDVAAAILDRSGPIDTYKLQKLLYYCQAWSLVWDGRPMFDNRIEAWADGPVVMEIYRQHRRMYSVSEWDGAPENLTDDEIETVEGVWGSYGKLSGRQLSQLTHQEAPWRIARGDLGPTDNSRNEIDLDDMQAFYASMDADENARPISELYEN